VHPNLTHASVDPPESTSQTASGAVQPFLHNSLQKVLYFTMDAPFPLKIARSHGALDPHLIPGSLGSRESMFQMSFRSVQHFLQGLQS